MRGCVLGFDPLLRALDLTDDQQTQVRDVFVTYRATMKPLWEQLRTARQQLTDILVSLPPLYTSTLQTAEQELTSLQEQTLHAHLTPAQAIRVVLTPDQLTQATQLQDRLHTLQTTRHQLLAPQDQPW
jgi:Spy/CpxP family protein refolding chaperone